MASNIQQIAERLGAQIVAQLPDTGGGAFSAARLARILGGDDGQLSAVFARDILAYEISEQDKARMHDLAARNQADELTPAEKAELFGFAKATTLISILKSKARRTLRQRDSVMSEG